MLINRLLLQPNLQARAFYREPSVLRLRKSDDGQTIAPSNGNEDAEKAGAEAAGDGKLRDSPVDEQNSDSETTKPVQASTATSTPPAPGKDVPAELGPNDEWFPVDWEPGESNNPQNWTETHKWCMTISVAIIATVVGMGSSVDSAGIEYSSRRFGVSVAVGELQTAVYLIGFGISAPIFGPLSEVAGRVPVYCFTMLIFSLFEMGSAISPNIQTRIILRFFAGFWGSTPLSNAGGSVADMVSPRSRTLFFPVFSLSGFLGPALGPVIGGYLAMNAGQEWCDWVMAFAGFALTAGLMLFMRETYAPVLLKDKAQAVRNVTGDGRYMTALERQRFDTPFIQAFGEALKKPLAYLFYEPIVMAFSFALSLIYLVFFGSLEGYGVIYQAFNFNAGEVGLVFLALCVGLAFSMLPMPYIYRRYLRREREAQAELVKLRESGVPEEEISPLAGQPPPEERLIHGMIGTWFLVAGLFWQGWTSILTPNGSPWPSIVAIVFVGAGVLAWFISSYQYIIDVYGTGSASALATLTLVRYPVAGGATMFSRQMYTNLRPQWAMTLLGCLAFVFSFIPYAYYIYGPRIRSWSRYART